MLGTVTDMPKTDDDLSRLAFPQVMTTGHVLPRPAERRHALCVVVGDSHARAAIEDRRVDLGMSQDDLARTAEISMSTLQRVLRGHAPLPKTARAIERALGWERGSLDDVGDGNAPRLLADQTTDVAEDEMSLEELRATVTALSDSVDKLRAQLERMEAQRERTVTARTNRAIR